MHPTATNKTDRVKKFMNDHGPAIAVTALFAGAAGIVALSARQASKNPPKDLFIAWMDREKSINFAPKFASLLDEFQLDHNLTPEYIAKHFS